MLKKTRILALTGFAALLTWCQACSADNKQTTKAKEVENTQEKEDEEDQVAVADTAPTAGQPSKVESSSTKAPQEADIKKLSEAFGHFIGRNLKSPGINFDLESIIQGMRDGSAGKPAPLSDQEYEELMAVFQEKAFKEMAETNLKAAVEFLAKNAKEKGIIEIEPGKLQYLIVKEGTGSAVSEQSTPTIVYSGRYLDGTVFGSSEETGGPITIPLKQTIPGFSKGVAGMKEGEKRKVFVHPDLGYGTSGQLPPNELLIFEVEVVKADTKPDVSDAEEEDLEDGSDELADDGNDEILKDLTPPIKDEEKFDSSLNRNVNNEASFENQSGSE